MSSDLEERSISILALSSEEEFWPPGLSPERRLFGELNEVTPPRFSRNRKQLYVRSLDGSLCDPTVAMMKHRSASNLLKPHFSDLAGKRKVEQREPPDRKGLYLAVKQSALEKSMLENRKRQFEPKKHFLKPTIRLKKVINSNLSESVTELPRLSRLQNLDASKESALFAEVAISERRQSAYMGTLNPDEELNNWTKMIAPAIEISCKSHYGQDADLPIFPWFLESQYPDVSEVLGRLAKATKGNVKVFSSEVASFLGKTTHEITEKKQSLLVNRMDVVSIERRLHSLTNAKGGPSRISVKSLGGPMVLTIISRTKSTGKNPEAELSLDVVTVEFESDEIYVDAPKDILCELTLEKLSLSSVIYERSTRVRGELITLELTIHLSERDQLDLLTIKISRLEDIKNIIEADITRSRMLIEHVMEALDIKDEPKLNQPKQRDCEYCVLI